MNINIEDFEFAIKKIDDGFVFESFANNFLSGYFGANFIPVGGTKDRGIDGFTHLFCSEGKEKYIYQLSTESDFKGKIINTIETLNKNSVDFTKLCYVTNRNLNQTESFIDTIFEEYGIPLTIYDIRWFKTNCNYSPHTINSYRAFVDTYLHEYSKPGKTLTVANLSEDSRLYVFLGQQFENDRNDFKLDELLADTLIIYSLEDTDPAKGIFKTEEEIKESIRKYLKFDPQLLNQKITERLEALSTKPRKIQYNSKGGGYCLPYETRITIEDRNIHDEKLHADFFNETKSVINKCFSDVEVGVKDIEQLITIVFNRIYSKQGLEFSNFVLNGDSQSIVELNLNDVIGTSVDESNVVEYNKEKVKTALHLAIREIVYKGSENQRKYLKSLSNTYLMMFLLHWEPKLTVYFETLASQLKVFVDNSILIPAFSEFYLPAGNKRHWNLLKGSNKSGIKLFINETILDELISHFRMIRNIYYINFKEVERFYLNDAIQLLYIDEIMIRAYFYAKSEGRVKNFDDYIDNFIDPFLGATSKADLITYLQEEFGITFISNEAWDIKIDEDEKNILSENLKEMKNSGVKANNDAEMILTIYYLRQKFNEIADGGIFGYKTWWLSKDTSTYKAVRKAFGDDKYPVSCYLRPDFIYNYIALTPTSQEVDDAYSDMFPTMLGVNLSYHLPKEVTSTVQEKIKQFHDKNPIRVKQIINNLTDRLKTDPNLKNKNSLELFLDEELGKISSAH